MVGMVKDNQSSDMLTVQDVAKILHVHTNTLRRWSDQGLIKSYRITFRGDRRYKYKDIIDYLKERNNEYT